MAKSRARKLADIIVGAGIDIDGNLTFDGGSTSADLTFADNDKANFGDASDLQIYHDGSSNLIQGSNGSLYIQAKAGENSILATPDGGVNVYHDNSLKFETTSSGATITGTLVADGLTMGDNELIQLGTGNDLRIYHDGSHSRILENGTGNLIIQGTNLDLADTATGETFLRAVSNDSVEIYYDGSKKFETTSSGVDVTGGLTSSGNVTLAGTGNKDVYLGTIGSTEAAYISRYNDDFYLMNKDSGDLIFGTNNSNKGRFTSSGNFQIGTTTVIDSSRNLTNIGTIASTGEIGVTNGSFTLSSGYNVQWGGAYSSGFPSIFANSTQSVLRFAPSGNTDGIVVEINTGGLDLKVGSYEINGTTVIDSSRNLTNIGTISSGNITSSGTITAEGGELYLGEADTASAHINSYEVMTFNIDSDNDDTNRYFGWFKNGNSGSGTSLMRLTEDGYLGIGETSPDTPLEVKSSGTGESTGIRLTDINGTIRGNLYFGGAQNFVIHGASAPVGADAPALQFATGGSTPAVRMTVLEEGNVGIGTTSPFAKSHIVDTSWSSGAPYGTVQLIEGNNVNDNNWGHLVVTDTTTSAGNGGAISFAIGTSSALHPFAGIKGVSEGTSYGGIGLFTRASGGTATERMRIDSSGNVGIGTTAPITAIHAGTTGGNAYSSTITRGSNMKGGVFTQASNGDDMVGVYFATGSSTAGTHWSGITGSRTNNASHWGTQLNFYTHANDVANLNDATQKMVIKGDGKVGIGTTSPSAKLHVNAGEIRIASSSAYNTHLNYQDTGVNIISQANSGTTEIRNSSSTLFYLNASGNVGIGTTSPQMGLHVGSGTQAIAALAGIGIANGSSAYSFFQASDGTKQYIAGVDHNITYTKSGTLSNHDHAIVTNNANRIYIKNTGNVGIGTTSPVSLLHIKGSGTYNHTPANPQGADFVITSSEMSDNNAHSIMQLVSVRQSLTTGSGSTGYLGFSTMDDSNNAGINDAARIAIVNEGGSSVTSATALSFWTNAGGSSTGAATERMRIDSAGNVGIGDTTPDEKLSVYGAVTSSYQAANFAAGPYRANMDIIYASKKVRLGSIQGSNTPTGNEGEVGIYVNSGEKVTIDVNGNVGIGTTSPTGAKLHVAGGIKGTDLIAHDSTGINLQTDEGTKRLVVLDSGGVVVGGTSADTSSSMGGQSPVLFADGYTSLGGLRIKGTDTGNTIYKTGGAFGLTLGDSNMITLSNSDSTARLNTANWEVLSGGQLRAYRGGNSAYAALFMDTGENLYIRNSWGMKDLVFDRDGNLGLGTNDPAVKMHIVDSDGEGLRLENQTAAPTNSVSNAPHLEFVGRGWDSNYGSKLIKARIEHTATYGDYGYGATQGALIFSVQGAGGINSAPDTMQEGMRIAAGSDDLNHPRVGIGEGNPGAQLQIQNGSQIGMRFDTNSKSLIRLLNNTIGLGETTNLGIGFSPISGYGGTYPLSGVTGGWDDDTSGGLLSFRTSTDGGSTWPSRMVIKHDGKVGIGTSSPDAQLDVSRGADTSGYNTTGDQRSEAGITVRNTSEGTNVFSGINLYTGASLGADWSINNVRAGNYLGDLTFKTRTGGSTWAEYARITHNGTVGLGTTTPITPTHKTSTVTASQSTSNGWSISTSGTYSARGAIEVAGITNRHIGKFGLSGNFSANTWYPIVKRDDLVSMAGNTATGTEGGFGVYFRIWAYTSSIGGGEYLANRVTETVWITQYGSNSNQTHEMRVGAGFGHAPNTGHDADDPSLCPIRMRIAHHYGSDTTWGNQQTFELNLDYALTGADPAAAGKQLIVYAYMI